MMKIRYIGKYSSPTRYAAGQHGRDRDRVRIAAPEHQGEVLEDEGEAHRGQHLAQLLAAQALEERVPLADADERDGERRPARSREDRSCPVRQMTVRAT